jgi:hypothetical protein
MWPKTYTGECCPRCGRENSAERIRRPQWARLLKPGTQMMRCRLCLFRYLVRR